jgi:hypothetical protein
VEGRQLPLHNGSSVRANNVAAAAPRAVQPPWQQQQGSSGGAPPQVSPFPLGVVMAELLDPLVAAYGCWPAQMMCLKDIMKPSWHLFECCAGQPHLQVLSWPELRHTGLASPP